MDAAGIGDIEAAIGRIEPTRTIDPIPIGLTEPTTPGRITITIHRHGLVTTTIGSNQPSASR